MTELNNGGEEIFDFPESGSVVTITKNNNLENTRRNNGKIGWGRFTS